MLQNSLQRPRRLETTDIATKAITIDPSLSCKSSQACTMSVHSCTAAGRQEVSTHVHKGNCHRRFPNSLQAQGPCRKCGALMAGMYLWERTYLPQAECAHCQRTLWPLLIAEETDRKASLYETQLFKFINIKNYAMML